MITRDQADGELTLGAAMWPLLARRYDCLSDDERGNNVKRALALLQVLPPSFKSGRRKDLARTIAAFESRLSFFSKVRDRLIAKIGWFPSSGQQWLDRFYENAFTLAEADPDLCLDESHIQIWLRRLEETQLLQSRGQSQPLVATN